MEKNFKEFLFGKRILVNDGVNESEEDVFNILVTLGYKFGIKIVKGSKLVTKDMIKMAEDCLGLYVPEPFYIGFPKTVREMTPEKYLFDQLFHYVQTYGLGRFEEAGHSIFEERFERLAFQESVTPVEYTVLNEKDAEKVLVESVEDLMAISRPLSDSQYKILLEAVKAYGVRPTSRTSKQTLCRLIYDLKDVTFADAMHLQDVIKLVDYINYSEYNNENLKKLNLKNQDRKFITNVLDRIFEKGVKRTEDCFEKRKLWCGLLHHIHYRGKTAEAKAFVSSIRNGANRSFMSGFETLMGISPVEAAKHLKETKGSALVNRNLNYILSRCRTEYEVKEVLKCL